MGCSLPPEGRGQLNSDGERSQNLGTSSKTKCQAKLEFPERQEKLKQKKKISTFPVGRGIAIFWKNLLLLCNLLVLSTVLGGA